MSGYKKTKSIVKSNKYHKIQFILSYTFPDCEDILIATVSKGTTNTITSINTVTSDRNQDYIFSTLTRSTRDNVY